MHGFPLLIAQDQSCSLVLALVLDKHHPVYEQMQHNRGCPRLRNPSNTHHLPFGAGQSFASRNQHRLMAPLRGWGTSLEPGEPSRPGLPADAPLPPPLMKKSLQRLEPPDGRLYPPPRIDALALTPRQTA